MEWGLGRHPTSTEAVNRENTNVMQMDFGWTAIRTLCLLERTAGSFEHFGQVDLDAVGQDLRDRSRLRAR